jgi:hypothetical protein
VITQNLGSYAWALWISAIVALFSVICAVLAVLLDKWIRARYTMMDHTDGEKHRSFSKKNIFNWNAVRSLPMTYWIVVLFSVFENAGVQSFVSISTCVNPSFYQFDPEDNYVSASSLNSVSRKGPSLLAGFRACTFSYPSS